MGELLTWTPDAMSGVDAPTRLPAPFVLTTGMAALWVSAYITRHPASSWFTGHDGVRPSEPAAVGAGSIGGADIPQRTSHNSSATVMPNAVANRCKIGRVGMW